MLSRFSPKILTYSCQNYGGKNVPTRFCFICMCTGISSVQLYFYLVDTVECNAEPKSPYDNHPLDSTVTFSGSRTVSPISVVGSKQ